MGIIRTFLDILFPPKCVFCGRVLGKNDDGWCDKCTEELPFADNFGHQNGENFDFCVSPLYYIGVVRRSILRYKFRGASFYAEAYGKLMAECIRENPELNYDIISWVPLSSKRERTRGYDQAMLLALATALELDDVAVETLKKHRDVRAQSELGDRAERSENIEGAYIASDPEIIAGKRVLLIDDIVTTCSTLEECAGVLIRAGASDVVCASLARGG
ncbi:MAG: double zinc ribbon domain-containing protein [Oscillospiraceae bacterium]|nr:double zinc ribbon domain-containing protein [Oscillospiraceae bacterium]MCL2278218.1 double zinc ribbon domain-containing protein [Oscillospiraceae bacterium]